MFPLEVQQEIDRGLEHHRAGRLAQAEQIYRKILSQYPNHPWPVQLMGMLAYQTGKLDLAEKLLRRAISLDPNVPDFYNNLGEILRAKKSLDEAGECYVRCLQLNPGFVPAYNNLGQIYRAKKDLDEAVRLYRQAIELEPNIFEPYTNLGIAVQDLGRPEEAMAAYLKALSLNPDHVDTHNNLGTLFIELRQVDEGIRSIYKALELNPLSADAHNNLSHALLLKGDFEAGWEEYEWRWESSDFPSPIRNFTQPMWNGEDPAGRKILVHAEQGFGDAIQFARYVPLLAERGATVYLECQPMLMTLFEGLDGVTNIFARGLPLPAFDFHVPLLSLPRAFKTTLETIPGTIPYLSADPQLVEQWRQKLGPSEGKLRIGLNWAGNPEQGIDRFRSLHLSRLAPLSAAKDVEFHSLQKGYASDQARTPPEGMSLIDHSTELTDFSQTAALMMNLDLILSTCTAVPHLAVLGRPVWTMLPFNSDWRWLIEGETTPWYPTMRLFRQSGFGDWDSVFPRVVEELTRLSSGRKVT